MDGGVRSVRRMAWIAATYVFLGLALVGVVVPVLPTTPFALLAAYCAARGSERLHRRLLAHRALGPVIRDWSEHRAVSRRTKVTAIGTMVLSSAVLLLVSGPGWILLGVAALMTTVATWLWLRPEPSR